MYDEFRYSTRSYAVQKTLMRVLESWLRPELIDKPFTDADREVVLKEVCKLAYCIEKRRKTWEFK